MYVTDATGSYVGSLWMAGGKSKYYEHLIDWYRATGGDAEAALAAVDKLLELEPDNLRGNIFKADHLQQMGNTRGALHFYQAALRLAARTVDHPEDVVEGLQRAQEACKQLDSEYQDFLLKRLSDEGFDLAFPERRASHEFIVTPTVGGVAEPGQPGVGPQTKQHPVAALVHMDAEDLQFGHLDGRRAPNLVRGCPGRQSGRAAHAL